MVWGDTNPAKIFREGNNFRKCPPPLKSTLALVKKWRLLIDPMNRAVVPVACTTTSKSGHSHGVQFKKELPWFTNWQHWGKGEYVTGLEPGTNPPIGQAKARKEKQLIFLAPGEIRSMIYNLKC